MSFKAWYYRTRMSPAGFLLWTWLLDPSDWKKSSDFSYGIESRARGVVVVARNNDKSSIEIVVGGKKEWKCLRPWERKKIYRLAHDIYDPPEPSKKIQRMELFKALMRAQLGEKE